MTELTLTIGDKNLSSWSLRPWLLMKQAGIPFSEVNICLDKPNSKKELKAKTPSGLVPFLRHQRKDGEVDVWESLAIVEYLNEQFPEKQLWPEDPSARAFARAISAEMHAGFSTMRTVWPMMVTRENMRHSTALGVQRDIDRIASLWNEARERFGQAGPFLFGAFSIADAFYAPVASRFVTYGPLDLGDAANAYRDHMMGLPAMKEWGEGAKKELELG